MRFIRIGKCTLNVAHVVEVKDEAPDLVKVKMAGFMSAPISFKGDEARAVREYFAFRIGDEVVDITPEYAAGIVTL